MLWEKVGRFKGKIRLSHTTHTSPCPRHRPRPARSPSLLRVRAVCPSKSCVRGSGAAVATKGASASGCAAGLSCTGGRGLAADASPPLPPQCRWLDRAVPVPNAHWWLIPMHWDWERLSPSPDRIFFSGFAAGQPSSPPARILLALPSAPAMPGRSRPAGAWPWLCPRPGTELRRSCCAFPFSLLFPGRVRAVPLLR